MKKELKNLKMKKIAINCETEQEAEKFINWCHENEMEVSEDTEHNSFLNYNEKTCYDYDYIPYLKDECKIYYASENFYKKEGYTVIKYKDFFKGEMNMIKVKDIAEKYGEYEINENKLKELLVEPKPKTVWDLQVGDTYYCYILSNGYITKTEWKNDSIDNYRRDVGNCFLTYKEAEFEMERRKVETLLLRYGGTRNMMSIGCLHNEKYYMYYDNQCKSIEVNYNYCNQEHNIYFKSRKDCWDAIERIGIDRIKKYLFHVEEGNKNDYM